MTPSMTDPDEVKYAEPISIPPVSVAVAAAYGPDWFPLYIKATPLDITLYLRRAELRALRDRLDEIDRAFPEPGEWP